jgi:hypothetical protein
MSDQNQPPSQPPAGFYPDASGTMRWWDGRAWTEHTQVSSPPQQALPPAGWHPDPRGESRLRYWDGRQWTAHVDPPIAASPASEEGQSSSKGQQPLASPIDEPGRSATVESVQGPITAQVSRSDDNPVAAWVKTHRGLTAVAAVFAALILIGSLAQADETPEEVEGNLAAESTPAPEEVIETPEPEITAEPDPEPTPEPKDDGIPNKQANFLSIVERAALKAESGNEIAVVKARKKRGRDICALMPALKATNWVGEVEDASTELGGDSGVLALRLNDSVAVQTWNNSASDIGSNTLISPSSSLYDKLGNLSEGDKVTFSGRFVRAPNCLEEQSLIDENGVLTPDFSFKFSSIN